MCLGFGLKHLLLTQLLVLGAVGILKQNKEVK